MTSIRWNWPCATGSPTPSIFAIPPPMRKGAASEKIISIGWSRQPLVMPLKGLWPSGQVKTILPGANTSNKGPGKDSRASQIFIDNMAEINYNNFTLGVEEEYMVV